jgi:BrxA
MAMLVAEALEDPHDQPITSRLSGAGSLRRELEAVLSAATPDTHHEDYRRLVLEENVAGKGSASMRKWTWKRLRVRYLLDPEVSEFRAFLPAMTAATDPADRGLIAHLMVARTDRLFREVTLSTVVPHLRRIGQLIDADEVRAEVDTAGRSRGLDWSDETAKSIANHLLSSLKDFGVLVGSARKRVQAIRPGPAVTVFAVRLGRLQGLSDRRLLESQWFQLLGSSLSEALELMYKAAKDGALEFRFQADVAEIVLPRLEAAS